MKPDPSRLDNVGEFGEVLGGCGDDAEQQAGGVAEDRPLLVLLSDCCSRADQPRDLSWWIVSLHVEVDAARSFAQVLHHDRPEGRRMFEHVIFRVPVSATGVG